MRKLFIFILLGILLVGIFAFVSRDKIETTENNTYPQLIQTENGLIEKNYILSEQKIILTNKDTLQINEIKLNTPLVYEINGVGYQKVAEIEFASSEDFKSYLTNNNFELIDLNTNQKISRQLDFKYKSSSKSCSIKETLVNGTQIELCQQEEWKDINKYVFKSGEPVTIGIFTYTYFGDNVEWIPTLYGVEITEWASFQINQRFALQDAWTQEELPTTNYGSDTKLSSLGAATGHRSMVLQFNISDVNGTAADSNLSLYLYNDFGGVSFTIYAYYASNQTWGEDILTFNLETILGKDGTGGNSKSTSGVGWYVWNITTILQKAINNGDKNLTVYLNASGGNLGYYVYFGSSEYGTAGQRPYVNLSFIEAASFLNININLVSPNNNTISTTNNLNFSVNVTPTNLLITNVSLLINGSIVSTNTSGLTGIYNFPKTLPDGNHNWTVIAYGNNSIQYTATNGTLFFTVSTTFPQIDFGVGTADNNSYKSQNYIYVNASVTTETPANITFTLFNTSLVNSTFKLMQNQTSNNTINWTGLSNGIYYYNVSMYTLAGFYNATSTRTITLDTVNPLITLNSPVNYTNSTNGSMGFNVVATDDIGINYTALWLDGILNETNSSGFNGTYIFNKTFSVGTHSWKIQTVDLAGNTVNSSAEVFTIDWVFLISQDYDAFVIEGESSQFQANFTTNASSQSQVTIGYFVYNGTSNLGTIASLGGGNYSVTISHTAPIVSTSTNYTFYWNVTLANSYYQNFTSQQQNVSNIGLTDCTVTTFNFMNLSLYDEDDRTSINGTIETLFKIYSNVDVLAETLNSTFNYTGTPKKLCVSANLTSGYYYTYLMKYYGNLSSYYPQYKQIQNMTINVNNPQDIQLYDLLLTSGYPFKIRLAGITNNQDLLIDVQRQYIPINNFLSIFSLATDASGAVVAPLVQGTVIYNFIISQNGTVIATFNNYQVKCDNPSILSCSITLPLSQATADAQDFENYGGVSQTLLFNNNTRNLFLTFSTTDGNSHNVTQGVIQNTGYGNSTICYNSLSGTSGTIICNIPISYGNVTFYSNTYVDGKLKGTNFFSTNPSSASIFGGVRVILMMLMYTSLVFLFISNPIIMIIGALLGMVFAVSLYVIDGGSNLQPLFWLSVAVVIIIWQISKRI